MSKAQGSSGAFAAIGRLLADDFYALRWLVLGWWLTVFGAAAWVVRFETILIPKTGDIPQYLALLGPLIAGTFTLRHAMTRRAFWRTRPWHRWHLLAAKLIGILAFIWLPAALAQWVVISSFGSGERLWFVYLAELLITPGAWLLALAAIASLCASFRAFMGVSTAIFFARALVKTSFSKRQLRSGEFFDVAEPLIFLIAALLCLAVVYATGSRRWAVAAAVLPFFAWTPAFHFDWPRKALPESPLEITRVWPLEKRGSSPPTPGIPPRLCVRFELEGLAASGPIPFRSNYRFLVSGQVVARSKKTLESTDHKFDSSLGPWTPAFSHSFPIAQKIVDRHRGSLGKLELELEVGNRYERILDEVPMATGAVVAGRAGDGQHVEYRLESFALEDVAAEGSEKPSLKMNFSLAKEPILSHLLARPDFDHRVVLLPEESVISGGTFHSKNLSLFPNAQSFTTKRRQPDFSVPVESSSPSMRLVETGIDERHRLRATLEDVTLGRLICQ